MISKNEVFGDENELKWLPYTSGKKRENIEQAFNNLMVLPTLCILPVYIFYVNFIKMYSIPARWDAYLNKHSLKAKFAKSFMFNLNHDLNR